MSTLSLVLKRYGNNALKAIQCVFIKHGIISTPESPNSPIGNPCLKCVVPTTCRQRWSVDPSPQDSFNRSKTIQLLQSVGVIEGSKCRICDVTLASPSAAAQHACDKHPDVHLPEWGCPLCHRNFCGKDDLKTHIHNVHRDDLLKFYPVCRRLEQVMDRSRIFSRGKTTCS